ncbi:MAG: isoprenyl transferase [Pseudomonadota bacterium]
MVTNNPENTNNLNIPKHIAIIMDGNGRWAQNKCMPRIKGHIKGVETVRNIVTFASDLGIKYLTLYSFSTENWSRPKIEVSFLMKLLKRYIRVERITFMNNDIKVKAIGKLSKIPRESKEELDKTIKLTENNKGLTLVLALSYSGREEISDAIKVIIKKHKNSELNPDELDYDFISKHLYTKDIPDPDLLIRTGGDYRISNFLLWQLAYSELYFTEKMWPEFTKDDLTDAINSFKNRERRFGKI